MSRLSQIAEGGKQILSAVGKKGKTIGGIALLGTAATIYSGPQILKNLNIGGEPVAESIFHNFVDNKLSQAEIQEAQKRVEIHFNGIPHIPILVSEKNSNDARVVFVPEHATQGVFLNKLPIEQRGRDATKWGWSTTFYGSEMTDTGVSIGFEVKRSHFDEGIDSDGTSDADDWDIQGIQTGKSYTILGLKINGQTISFANQSYNKWGAHLNFSDKTPDPNQIIDAAGEKTNNVINTVSNKTSNLLPGGSAEPKSSNNNITLEPTN